MREIFAVYVEASTHPRKHWLDSLWTEEKAALARGKLLAKQYDAGSDTKEWEVQVDLLPVDEVISKFNCMVIAGDSLSET